MPSSTIAGWHRRGQHVVDQEELVPGERDGDECRGGRRLAPGAHPAGGEDPADDRRGEEVAVAQAGDPERGRLQARQAGAGSGCDEHRVGRLELVREHERRVDRGHRDDTHLQQHEWHRAGQQPPESDGRARDQRDRGQLAGRRFLVRPGQRQQRDGEHRRPGARPASGPPEREGTARRHEHQRDPRQRVRRGRDEGDGRHDDGDGEREHEGQRPAASARQPPRQARGRQCDARGLRQEQDGVVRREPDPSRVVHAASGREGRVSARSGAGPRPDAPPRPWPPGSAAPSSRGACRAPRSSRRWCRARRRRGRAGGAHRG